jgi:hypothetical protein
MNTLLKWYLKFKYNRAYKFLWFAVATIVYATLLYALFLYFYLDYVDFSFDLKQWNWGVVVIEVLENLLYSFLIMLGFYWFQMITNGGRQKNGMWSPVVTRFYTEFITFHYSIDPNFEIDGNLQGTFKHSLLWSLHNITVPFFYTVGFYGIVDLLGI